MNPLAWNARKLAGRAGPAARYAGARLSLIAERAPVHDAGRPRALAHVGCRIVAVAVGRPADDVRADVVLVDLDLAVEGEDHRALHDRPDHAAPYPAVADLG